MTLCGFETLLKWKAKKLTLGIKVDYIDFKVEGGKKHTLDDSGNHGPLALWARVALSRQNPTSSEIPHGECSRLPWAGNAVDSRLPTCRSGSPLAPSSGVQTRQKAMRPCRFDIALRKLAGRICTGTPWSLRFLTAQAVKLPFSEIFGDFPY